VRLVAMAVALGEFCFGVGLTVFRVTQISVRQAIVPDTMLGRVGGAMSVLGWGIAPLGAVVGGLLGQALGLQVTLVIGAVLEAATALVIWQSPLWMMRDVALNGATATGN
jgi:predicted MFS family arabinose efflux permease